MYEASGYPGVGCTTTKFVAEGIGATVGGVACFSPESVGTKNASLKLSGIDNGSNTTKVVAEGSKESLSFEDAVVCCGSMALETPAGKENQVRSILLRLSRLVVLMAVSRIRLASLAFLALIGLVRPVRPSIMSLLVVRLLRLSIPLRPQRSSKRSPMTPSLCLALLRIASVLVAVTSWAMVLSSVVVRRVRAFVSVVLRALVLRAVRSCRSRVRLSPWVLVIFAVLSILSPMPSALSASLRTVSRLMALSPRLSVLLRVSLSLLRRLVTASLLRSLWLRLIRLVSSCRLRLRLLVERLSRCVKRLQERPLY